MNRLFFALGSAIAIALAPSSTQFCEAGCHHRQAMYVGYEVPVYSVVMYQPAPIYMAAPVCYAPAPVYTPPAPVYTPIVVQQAPPIVVQAPPVVVQQPTVVQYPPAVIDIEMGPIDSIPTQAFTESSFETPSYTTPIDSRPSYTDPVYIPQSQIDSEPNDAATKLPRLENQTYAEPAVSTSVPTSSGADDEVFGESSFVTPARSVTPTRNAKPVRRVSPARQPAHESIPAPVGRSEKQTPARTPAQSPGSVQK